MMLRLTLVALLAAAGALRVSPAQALSPQLEQCLERAHGDSDAEQCWMAERERQDRRVADLHRRLAGLLRSDAERAGFEQAQSAWLRFRDATCAWERRAMLCCDLTERVAEATCFVERSEARAADLERLVAAFGPEGPLYGGPPTSGAPAGAKPSVDGMIFPDSSERLLRAAELGNLSRPQLRLARNEIYARRGRIFDSPDLQEYFGRQAWYRPLSRDVALTPIERANVTMIETFERRR